MPRGRPNRFGLPAPQRPVPFDQLPLHTRSGSVVRWPQEEEEYYHTPSAFGPRSQMPRLIRIAEDGLADNGIHVLGHHPGAA